MKLLSKEEIYKNNQRRIKAYGILAPVCFWVLLVLSVLCFILAICHSLGNVGEIIDLLETSNHTGEELQGNYAYLTAKYGEWVIGNGNAGFQLVFINLKRAVFSGFMITCFISSIVFLVGAYVLGKWLFPYLAKKTLQENQDMVNLTILKGEDRK